MKIFLILFSFLILATLWSCNSKIKKPNLEKAKTTIEKQTNTIDKYIEHKIKEQENFPIQENDANGLINIEKELKNKSGVYMLSYQNSVLSLIHETLFNPMESVNLGYISSVLPDYELRIDRTETGETDTFSKGKSFVKIIEWNNPNNDEIETYLYKGLIIDKMIKFPIGVQIGMNKRDFMSIFFNYSDRILDELKQVSACQDDRGEFYTKYKFSDDKLIEIEFGNLSDFEFEIKHKILN